MRGSTAREITRSDLISATIADGSAPTYDATGDKTRTLDGDRIRSVVSRAGYTLGDRLGEGGMSRVFGALHDATGVQVAIKAPRTPLKNPSRARRALHEATVVAQLGHPSIVTLLDVIRDEELGLLLVLELVEGTDLEEWRDHYPGWPIVREVLFQLLDGLSAAHAVGVVHADLKPGNLLIDGSARLGIADFGVARFRDPLDGERGLVSVAGTPLYMAPEQIVQFDAVGPSSDLYAVGAILYEWIAGTGPFDAAAPQDLSELLALQREHVAPPVPLSGRSCPPGLPELVAQLLDPNPRHRPRFAADVLRRLGELDSGYGGPGRPAPSKSAAEGLRVASVAPEMIRPAIGSGGSLLRMRPAPLIGRERERAFLSEEIDAVVESGKPRCLVWIGDSGVGKSRLARWGLECVERIGLMEGLAAGYDIDGGGLLRGLRAPFVRLLGLEGDSPDWPERWAWLRAAKTNEDPKATQPPFDASMMSRWLAGTVLPRDEVVSLAFGALEALSRIRPVYLWLDDIGWADDGALELVDRILWSQLPVLVVATIRSGTVAHRDVRPYLSQWDASPASCQAWELELMTVTELSTLADSMTRLPRDVAIELGRRADGHPLQLLELVYAVDDHLHRSPAGGVAEAMALAAEVPTRKLLDQRVAALFDATPECEAVLVVASLFGEFFEEAPLDAAFPDHKKMVVDAIDEGLRHGLLRAEVGGGLRFEHGAVHAVVSRRVETRPDRGDLYRRAAQGLSVCYGRERLDVGAEVARLLHLAGDRTEALSCLLEASYGLARSGDLAHASELAELAKSWLSEDDQKADLVGVGIAKFVAGIVQYFEGSYDRAAKTFRDAEVRLRAAGAASFVWRARQLRADAAFFQGRYGEALALLEELTDVSVREEASRVKLGMFAYFRLGELEILRENFPSALDRWRNALLLAKHLQERFWYRVVLRAFVEACVAVGELREARCHFRALRQELHSTDDTSRDFVELETRLLLAEGDWQRAALLIAALDPPRGPVEEASRRCLEALYYVLSGNGDVSSSVRAMLQSFALAPPVDPFSVWALRPLAAGLATMDMELAAEVDAFRMDRRATVEEGLAL